MRKILSEPQKDVTTALERPELIEPPVGSTGPRIWEQKHYKTVLRLIAAQPYHAVRQKDAEAALEKVDKKDVVQKVLNMVGIKTENFTAAQVLLSMVEYNVVSLRPYSEMAKDLPRQAVFKEVWGIEEEDSVVTMPSPAHLAAVLELDVELEE